MAAAFSIQPNASIATAATGVALLLLGSGHRRAASVHAEVGAGGVLEQRGDADEARHQAHRCWAWECTALLVLALIVIMCTVLWRSLRVASARERALVTTDRALRASETRLTKLLEQLPLGVGVFDLDGRLISANPVLRRFTRDRIPSQDPREVDRWRTWASDGTPIEPAQWPGARALAGATVNPGVDFLYSGDDGRDVWTRVSAAPFRDDGGAITGVIWVVQDIDERKRAENALTSTERQLRLVADHAPVLIAHCDTDARYKFVNRAYAERFGLTPEQVICWM